jgi:transcription initiation factor IIE alpha subunit
MGQQEIYDLLKKNKKKWFNSREITRKLNSSISSVTNCLRKLRENKIILSKYKRLKNSHRKTYWYKYKK